MFALRLDEKLNLYTEDTEKPTISAKEILVRPMVVGLCGSDKRLLAQGSKRLLFPATIGHEISGEIVEVGKDIHCWAVGERVALNSSIPCLRCEPCNSGFTNLCSEPRIFGYNISGGLCEYLKVPEAGVQLPVLYRMPDSMDFSLGALAEPLSAVIHAVRKCGDLKSRSIAIVGGGFMAVLFAIVANIYGAESIVIFVSKRKLDKIRKLNLINTVTESLDEDYKITSQRKFDNVISCPDSLDAQHEALKILSFSGNLVLFGVTPRGAEELRIRSNDIHYLEWSLKGSFGSTNSDFTEALDLLSRYGNRFGDIVDLKISLRTYNSIFQPFLRGEILKGQVLVNFDDKLK